MNDLSKASLIKFLEMMIEKGWVNSSTGAAMRTAARKILSVVPEDTDVGKIDVAMALRQYNNLNPGELSPDSLKIYEQRVVRAIKQFQSYVEDPQNFKVGGRTAGSAKNGKTEKSAKVHLVKQKVAQSRQVVGALPDETQRAQQTQPHHTSSTPHAVATDLNLALPFPLRANFLAQVVIPRDLSKDEAERMCAFIKALAQ